MKEHNCWKTIWAKNKEDVAVAALLASFFLMWFAGFSIGRHHPIQKEDHCWAKQLLENVPVDYGTSDWNETIKNFRIITHDYWGGWIMYKPKEVEIDWDAPAVHGNDGNSPLENGTFIWSK